MMKTYSELITYKTFNERLRYLFIGGSIGIVTFGNSRYLNQIFYRSYEWKKFRRYIIIRDNGCDLGIDDIPINTKIYIHHLNPLSEEDILYRTKKLFDPENVICCSYSTHKEIHYGHSDREESMQRYKYDTCPWKI